jgi:hypothetical protein
VLCRITTVPSIAQTSCQQIRKLSFAIINSTTLALPGWRRACATHKLAPNLIPRDVTTRWNSTYDMLSFVLRYRPAIDTVTADKNLKLRKFELDDDEWKIVGDLVLVLEVCSLPYNLPSPLILVARNIKRLQHSSRRIQRASPQSSQLWISLMQDYRTTRSRRSIQLSKLR